MRLLLWVVATVVGCAIPGVIGHFPGSFPVGSGTQSAFAPPAAAYGLVMGTIFALPLGIAQWLVLRRSPGIGKRWIVATAVGVGVMHAAGDGAPAQYGTGILAAGDGWLAVGALGGFLIATQQVLAARGRLVAWTWIVGSVIAWPLGIVAGLSIAHGTGLMAQTGPAAWAQQHALVGVVTGLVVGILTGVLIPRPRPLTPATASAF